VSQREGRSAPPHAKGACAGTDPRDFPKGLFGLRLRDKPAAVVLGTRVAGQSVERDGYGLHERASCSHRDFRPPACGHCLAWR